MHIESNSTGQTAHSGKASTALLLVNMGTVAILVAVLMLVRVSPSGGTTPKTLGMQDAPTPVVSALEKVTAQALATAGVSRGKSGPYLSEMSIVHRQSALRKDGKPLVVWVGSNWCPYCASTRWPLVVALDRFGRFKNLKVAESGRRSNEPFPGSKTLSFYGATYSSSYLSFVAVEQCSSELGNSSAADYACNGYVPLESLTGIAKAVFDKYDFLPYQTRWNEGGIPFVDFGNRYVEDGTFIDPKVLTGYSWTQISKSLSHPRIQPGRTILASANYYTAMLCALTGNKPGSVCNETVVLQAAKAEKL